MQGASNFLQLKLILGITLGLAMGQHVMAAAPLCAEVLKLSSSAIISEADLDRTFEDIARLKIAADLEKTLGPSSHMSVQNISEQVYKTKLLELITRLHGTKTDLEIKKQISKKIIQLQKRNQPQIEEATREAEKKTFVRSIYERDYRYQERINLPYRATFNNTTFEYVPKLNSLLVVIHSGQRQKIYLLDLNSKELNSIFDADKEGQIWNVNTSNNGRFVTNWVFSKDGEHKVFVFDTLTAEQRQVAIDPSIKPQEDSWIETQQMSPSGKSMLVIIKDLEKNQDKTAYLINMTTGKPQRLASLKKELNFPRSLSFINEHEVIFVDSRDGYALMRHNLLTKKTELLYKSKNYLTVKLDRDGKNIFILESRLTKIIRMISIDGKPFTLDKMTVFENPEELRAVHALPKSGLLAEDYSGRADLMTTFYGQDLPTGRFLQLPDQNPNYFDSKVATADPETGRIFFGYDPHWQPGQPHIDIWTP